jgi:hypothetical protein
VYYKETAQIARAHIILDIASGDKSRIKEECILKKLLGRQELTSVLDIASDDKSRNKEECVMKNAQ